MQVEQPRPAAVRTLLAVEEELANTVTHGIGLVLSLVALYSLLILAVTRGTPWHIFAFGFYGCSLVSL